MRTTRIFWIWLSLVACSADQSTARGTHTDGTGGQGGAGTTRPRREGCDERSAALAAATGNVLTVSPGSDGQVMVAGATMTLREAVNLASDGDTVLLENGTYDQIYTKWYGSNSVQ